MKNYGFNPEIYQTVARNVKKYRELKKLSIQDLARYAKVSDSFLERFEHSTENISISIYDLYKISVILDVNINLFFE